jgi:hypothetical protein
MLVRVLALMETRHAQHEQVRLPWSGRIVRSQLGHQPRELGRQLHTGDAPPLNQCHTSARARQLRGQVGRRSRRPLFCHFAPMVPQLVVQQGQGHRQVRREVVPNLDLLLGLLHDVSSVGRAGHVMSTGG